MEKVVKLCMIWASLGWFKWNRGICYICVVHLRRCVFVWFLYLYVFIFPGFEKLNKIHTMFCCLIHVDESWCWKISIAYQ